MKTRKSILTIIALLGFSYALLAIDASVSYATFKSPNQNYVEVYLYVSGRSVTFQPVVDSSFQAQLEVIILFKKDGEIVKGDKYSLSSPVVGQAVDFIDLKRYGLQNGVYELAVAIKDLNQPDNAKEFQTEFKMDYSEEGVQQSSLQLLASFQRSADGNNAFVKNGLQIEPLPYNFYGRNASSLIFYNEVLDWNICFLC